jgi:diguanylate cyclase (GGDEF)-like protein
MLEDIQEGTATILVADDEPINRSLIQRRLERAGYHVLTAQNGQEAVEKTRERLPDLVLLDIMMPVMDGLEACRLIKEDAATQDIPVIFLSARDETEVKVSGLNLGANDYISKPFKAEELLARVDVAMRMKRERDALRMSAEEAWAQSELAQEKAITDPLTGVLNRHEMLHSLGREHAEARRYSRPLACLMFDLDNFKAINDTHGHAAGDAALKQVANILIETVRRSDMVFRYGGDEFLALLPETDLSGARSLAEKIRASVDECEIVDDIQAFRLTISVGAAQLCDGESENGLLLRADTALQHAKDKGRNRVATNSCDTPLLYK